MLIACTRNRFDYWNSCKRLQNFVNVEALPTNEESFLLKFSQNIVFIMHINVKMPTIVGILALLSRINFMLS